jgi:hypothetical protein
VRRAGCAEPRGKLSECHGFAAWDAARELKNEWSKRGAKRVSNRRGLKNGRGAGCDLPYGAMQ